MATPWFLRERSSISNSKTGGDQAGGPVLVSLEKLARRRTGPWRKKSKTPTNDRRPRNGKAARSRQRLTPSPHATAVRPPASVSPHPPDGRRFRWVSERKRPLMYGQRREPMTRFVATWPANPQGQPRGSQEWWLSEAGSDVQHPNSQRIAIIHRRDWLLTKSP